MLPMEAGFSGVEGADVGAVEHPTVRTATTANTIDLNIGFRISIVAGSMALLARRAAVKYIIKRNLRHAAFHPHSSSKHFARACRYGLRWSRPLGLGPARHKTPPTSADWRPLSQFGLHSSRAHEDIRWSGS